LKVEIRIKTKNGIEDIIKKHGKTDIGKNSSNAYKASPCQ